MTKTMMRATRRQFRERGTTIRIINEPLKVSLLYEKRRTNAIMIAALKNMTPTLGIWEVTPMMLMKLSAYLVAVPFG